MAQPKPKSFSLTLETIKDTQSILNYIADSALNYRVSLLRRLETVMQYAEKSSDRSETAKKGQVANRVHGQKQKIGDTEVAVIKMQLETSLAFYAGTFLSGYPIFAATSTKEGEAVAEMLTALTARDQDEFNWTAELMQCHKDVHMVPVCAAEVYWDKKKGTTVTTNLNSTQTNTVAVSAVSTYEGNRIKHIPIQNLLVDTSVPPYEVHTRGTFAGYVEKLSYVAMKAEYDNLDPLYTIKVNQNAIFKVVNPNSVQTDKARTQLYQYPTVHRSRIEGEAQLAAGENDWGAFWGGSNKSRTGQSNLVTAPFERVRMYVRISLKDFGYAEASDDIVVCLLIWINGYLAYFEPMLNSHGYLPIVLGQIDTGDINTSSFCEYLLDLQDLSTAMIKGATDSMRKAIYDRALYDPRRIRPEDINSPLPASKIAVNMNTYNANFDTAYKAIPYVDNVSANLVSFMQLIDRLADRTTGQNQAVQGNFVKGNKTREEFDTVMTNAQARSQLGAVFLEQHFYSGIKTVLRANYLLYAQADEIQLKDSDKIIPVDPAELRKAAPKYKMASGLMPVTKLAGTEALIQAVQFMSVNPLLSIEYDVGAMIVSALKQMGVQGLDQYKRPVADQQRVAALQNPPKETQSGEPSGQQPPAAQ
jgi:hypothetical protein